METRIRSIMNEERIRRIMNEEKRLFRNYKSWLARMTVERAEKFYRAYPTIFKDINISFEKFKQLCKRGIIRRGAISVYHNKPRMVKARGRWFSYKYQRIKNNRTYLNFEEYIKEFPQSLSMKGLRRGRKPIYTKKEAKLRQQWSAFKFRRNERGQEPMPYEEYSRLKKAGILKRGRKKGEPNE